MRLAYLDGCAGISGDMLLGAFLHAGVPAELFHDTLKRLDLGASLNISEVDRSGIRAVKATILCGDAEADAVAPLVQHHSHETEPVDDHDSPGSGHRHDDAPAPLPGPGLAAKHKHEMRSLASIRALIERASLPEPVTVMALRAFTLLGETEAAIHGLPIEEVHFHEVGAVDAIADIVLAAAAAHALQIDEWHCSALNIGGGTVRCAHGLYPVPAPATAALLRGAPTYSSGVDMELVTPTGAALVRALDCRFGPAPRMRAEKIGYGAGTRNPAGFANVLRLTTGQAEAAADHPSDVVTVMETAIDDLNPQVVAYVMERALKMGALDVMCTPVVMKKGRPGILLTILSSAEQASALEDLLLEETSTLGLRVRQERRVCLHREHVSVTTEWGPIRIKVGLRDGAELKAAPEFEDCRAIAEKHSVPLKHVMEAALGAYRNRDFV
jgi:uncharacterized protein (TIGR00299 family) protein